MTTHESNGRSLGEAMREQFREMERCRQLGHPDAYWARRVASNGAEHLCYWCDRCARAVTKEMYDTPGQNVRAEWLEATHGIRARDIPIVRESARFSLCARCRATGPCELHHVAPRAVFPEDADEWPVMPLCKGCHDRFTQGFEAYVQRRIEQALDRAGLRTVPDDEELEF